MDFQPYDLAGEIRAYFNLWQESELDELTRLKRRQLDRLVAVVQNHPDAAQVYSDFQRWFSNTSERPDVMSDAFISILDDELEQMFC